MTLATMSAELEIVEVQGVRIPIDPVIMSPSVQAQIRRGKYERLEARMLPGIVEPGERIVELGAGIGFLSALVGLQGKADSIVVIEANPALIPLIKETHRLNGIQAEVHNAAVVGVKHRETVPFHLHQDFWGSSMEQIKAKQQSGVVDIPAWAIGDIIDAYSPTMLIMDVEGSETEVLKNVQLPGVRKVFMEIHHKVIGGEGVRSIFDFFSDQGFCYDAEHSQYAALLFSRID